MLMTQGVLALMLVLVEVPPQEQVQEVEEVVGVTTKIDIEVMKCNKE